MDAAEFGFFNRIFSELDTALSVYVSDVVVRVIDSLGPVTSQLLVLYFIIHGLMMMRGMVDEPITDFAWRAVRLSLITGLALNVGYYNSAVVDFIWRFPEALAALVVQEAPGSGSAAYLDSLMSQMYSLGTSFWAKGTASTIPHVGLILCAIAVWIVGLALTAYAAFLLCLSKFMLAILLALGPVFIVLLMFNSTKRFFESWLGQALNYGFMVVLAGACIKLVMAVLEMYLLESGAGIKLDPQVSDIVPAAAICVIGSLLLAQVNSVASALGGGVAISTLGAAGAVYNKAKGGIAGAKNVATGKTLSDMRAARRQKDSNARWASQNPGKTARAAGIPMAAYRQLTASRFNNASRG